MCLLTNYTPKSKQTNKGERVEWDSNIRKKKVTEGNNMPYYVNNNNIILLIP